MKRRQTTVVVCTRNRPGSLERCLQSVAAGETQPLEIIVVDQSDNDLSAAVVERLKPTVRPALRYTRLNSPGQTRARNAGIQASSGSIIAFTDDDCTADHGWLAGLEKEMADKSVACVCGASQPANHIERPRQAMLSTLKHDRRVVARGHHNPVSIGRGNNMAFRKADLLRLGGFNESIGVGTPLSAGDDLDIFCRTLQSGCKIVHAPDALVYHDQPDDWRTVLSKKREYSLSSSAVLASRYRAGDSISGGLLLGKILYEFGYLLCGGTLRMNYDLAAIGWHSFTGSLRGIACAFNTSCYQESLRLYRLADRARRARQEPGGLRSNIPETAADI